MRAMRLTGWGRQSSVGIVLAFVAFLVGSLTPEAGTNRWTSNGPYGGAISMVVVDPSSPDTLYAATGGRAIYQSYGGGIFKSTDGGATWAAANSGLDRGNIAVLAIDPRTPSTLYAACSPAHDAGFYKTIDGGAHWGPVMYKQFYDLAVDPSNPSIIYGCGDYVDKSVDGGTTWVKHGHGLPQEPNPCMAIDPKTPSTLYVGSYSGVYKSTDAGITWIPANAGQEDMVVRSLAVDPVVPTTIYAGMRMRIVGGAGVLLRSLDGGMSWAEVKGGLPSIAIERIAFDPSNSSTLYACVYDSFSGQGAGIFKSTDGGESWAAASNGLPTPLVCHVTISPHDSSVLYASTFSGVYKSVDGGASWFEASRGITNQWTFRVAIDPSNPATRYAATIGGVFKSTDGGTTWALKSQGLRGVGATLIAIDPLDPRVLYAASLNQTDRTFTHPHLFKSADAGETWASLDLTGPFTALAIDPAVSGRLFVGHTSAFSKSKDGGQTWMEVPVPNQWIRSVAFDPAVPDRIYAAGIYCFSVSSDGGATWSEVPDEFRFSHLYQVLVEPAQPDTVYLCGYRTDYNEGGIFKSTDRGETFSGLGATRWVSPYTVAVDPTPPSTLYVALVGRPYLEWYPGVFSTADDGYTWQWVSWGLSNLQVMQLVSDPAKPRTLCASVGSPLDEARAPKSGAGSGVYSRTHVDVAPPVITEVHALGNPFRLVVRGSNFHPSAQVLINLMEAPSTTVNGSTRATAKKGSALKAMVPKGVEVGIRIENPDDGGLSEPFWFTR